MFKFPRKHLDVMALLLSAVALKCPANWPAGVNIIGSIHGAVFIQATTRAPYCKTSRTVPLWSKGICSMVWPISAVPLMT